MYPLLDRATMAARAEETRRTAAAARLALSARGESDTRVHGVRRALGVSLVRAGLHLIET